MGTADERSGLSLQDNYAPENRCFGCGPANEKGLRIKSFPVDPVDADAGLVCDWTPEEHHQAFGAVLNGGVIGALFDCHSNWTAMYFLMRRDGLERPPGTVTLDFHVKLRRPTSNERPLRLTAKAVSSEKDRVVVEATMTSEGQVTAICTGTFVRVKPGHPAFHRF